MPHKKIHKKIRKHAPNSVRKIKKVFSFKYPKLFLFILFIILAYYVFSRPFASGWMEIFNKLGDFGALVAGVLTGLGFVAPFGFGLLIKMSSNNMLLAVLLSGIGAALADLLIFKTIKLSFMDEFKKLEKTKVIHEIEDIVKKNKSVLIRHYFLYLFAGIMLATPLPDEIGVSMLAGLTTIKPLKLAIIGFALHSITAFFFLYYL